MHLGKVVLVAHEGKHIRTTTELHSIFLHIGATYTNLIELAIGNALDNQVLEQQELIVLGSGVHSVHNTGNQVLHTLHIKERHTKVLILNGNRVLHTPVHGMESCAHIRQRTLQLTVSSLFYTELPSLSNLDEYFLYRFAELKVALLKLSICVVEYCALYPYQCNTVHQSIDKLVSQCGITVQDFTHTGDIGSLGYFRNLRLILIACILTDSVKNIHRACVEFSYCNSFRHFIPP